MDDALDLLLALNAQVEADLGLELDALAGREAEAQRIITECFEERQRVDRKLAGLKEAARVYRESFGSNNLSNRSTVPSGAVYKSNGRQVPFDDGTMIENVDSAAYRPTRARIGPQRFLMLDAISTIGQLSIDDLSMFTKLTMRRIKDQLASDLKLGVVTQSGDLFTLTSAGMDLLERYKAYKRANHQPLPTMNDPPEDDERDENDVSGASEMHPEAGVPDYFIDDQDGRVADEVS